MIHDFLSSFHASINLRQRKAYLEHYTDALSKSTILCKLCNMSSKYKLKTTGLDLIPLTKPNPLETHCRGKMTQDDPGQASSLRDSWIISIEQDAELQLAATSLLPCRTSIAGGVLVTFSYSRFSASELLLEV